MTRFLIGLKLGLEGMLAKELRSRSRGWRSAALLTGYLLSLALGVAGFIALSSRSGQMIPPTIGAQVYSILALGFVIVLALITPALTAGSISGERERKTLDLLLITQASPLGVILGKWLGSVFVVLFLLIASLPAFALVFLFGGVPIASVGMVMLVAAVTALTYAALGLLLSALFRRTGVASLVTYLLVFVLVFGLPFVGLVQRSVRPMEYDYGIARPAPAYTNVSPITAVTSVLPGQTNQYGESLITMLLRRGGMGMPTPMALSSTFAKNQVVVGVDPTNGQPTFAEVWAPWVIYSLASAGITLLSIGWATLIIAPVKPWQAWRIRRRNRKAALAVSG